MALSLLFILYCFEAGLFFLIAPWTRFWTLNPLLHASPVLSLVVDNLYFRGMVSGFGIVHLLVAVREILVLVTESRRRSVRMR